MSKVAYKPEGFHSITPYLCVNHAAELLDFMKKAFGAKEIVRHNRPDRTVAHACVKIGDSALELGDVVPPAPMMPCAIHLYVPDVDAVYDRALKAGGVSQQKPTDQFYGDRSASVRDMCGNHWYIATQTEVLTKKQVEKRAAKAAS